MLAATVRAARKFTASCWPLEAGQGTRIVACVCMHVYYYVKPFHPYI